MLVLFSALAHAEAPAVVDPSVLPVFPENIVGDVDVECLVEMISDADGRLDVLDVTGCAPPFVEAVRDRLTWLTWKIPPPGPGPLEEGYAMLSGYAGVPGGLLVRMGIRFQQTGNSEPVVSVVGHEVVRPKKNPKKIEIPHELRESVGEGCRLVVHVDASGRTERVQSQTCAEGVREELELPLMAWTWEPLVVRGARRAFAATYLVTP